MCNEDGTFSKETTVGIEGVANTLCSFAYNVYDGPGGGLNAVWLRLYTELDGEDSNDRKFRDKS